MLARSSTCRTAVPKAEKRRGCSPGPTPTVGTLDALVAHYIEAYRDDRRATARRFAEMPSLGEAVRVAALSLTPEGKRHPHQRRIPGSSLSEAESRLQSADLGDVREFDELHARICAVCDGIDRFGELVRFDVAARIASHLGIEQKQVYLHAGSRKGAKALGLNHRHPTLDAREVPAPLRKLSAAEIEDFLCIYKDEFARIVST